jgi:hypothetical protein
MPQPRCSLRGRQNDVRARGLDPAGAHAHHAIAACGKGGIVRNKHERRAARALQLEDEIDDCVAGRIIEISGRLIRHKNCRVTGNRACERNALLLAARQLRGIMRCTIGETDGGEFLSRTL